MVKMIESNGMIYPESAFEDMVTKYLQSVLDNFDTSTIGIKKYDWFWATKNSLVSDITNKICGYDASYLGDDGKAEIDNVLNQRAIIEMVINSVISDVIWENFYDIADKKDQEEYEGRMDLISPWHFK